MNDMIRTLDGKKMLDLQVRTVDQNKPIEAISKLADYTRSRLGGIFCRVQVRDHWKVDTISCVEFKDC